jgi:SAM-dependent methyltransferase
MSGTTPLAYARWRESALGRVTERLERAAVLGLAGPLGGRDVLDLGCGDGAYALAAARAGGRVVAIDSSGPVIAAARRKVAAARLPVHVQVADARALPFRARSFDVVLAVTVLCFVRDPASVAAEIERVLRPGGLLVVGELGRWSVWAAWRRLRGWAGSRTWRSARFWSRRALREVLSRAGLVPGAVRGAAFYPPLGAAAKVMASVDPVFGRATHVGGAFLAIAAHKPADEP